MSVVENLKGLFEAIEATSVGVAVRESTWMFPTFETIHVLALVLVIGSIAIVDLRLLGLASRERGVKELSDDVLPWTWTSFLVAAITGALLFSSAATRYAEMIQFQVKMLLIVLAGINMILFHFITYSKVSQWNHTLPAPLAARVAGALSLFFWISVVTFGRWMGFV